MRVCMYECEHICVSLYVCICMHRPICIYLLVSLHIICVSVDVYLFACMYECMSSGCSCIIQYKAAALVMKTRKHVRMRVSLCPS